MTDHKITKNENHIVIEKLSYTHHLSKELSFNTVAEYDFRNNIGYIRQFSATEPKEYKRFANWKRVIESKFNIVLNS